MTSGTTAGHFFPENISETLTLRHKILRAIREYFDSAHYLEVETPLMVLSPGIDPYIDAMHVGSGFFLSPSPELQMKRLLTLRLPCIYQITHAFRENEKGSQHNPEFTILEWYHIEKDYIYIMQETEKLIYFLLHDAGLDLPTKKKYIFPFLRISVDELFRNCAGWEPSSHWNENRFFLDWVEKIEPYLKTLDGVFVVDFPTPLAALSRLKDDNSLICERFELFLGGLEIANAYTELIDHLEQTRRFKYAQEKRKIMGKEIYEIDTKFINALQSGIPDCAGAAMGLDRLIMALLGIHDIGKVQTFPFDRL
jgi:elongation factor P--(R)-beta-lysine ligase